MHILTLEFDNTADLLAFARDHLTITSPVSATLNDVPVAQNELKTRKPRAKSEPVPETVTIEGTAEEVAQTETLVETVTEAKAPSAEDIADKIRAVARPAIQEIITVAGNDAAREFLRGYGVEALKLLPWERIDEFAAAAAAKAAELKAAK
jgi:hypothetical protein